MSTFIKYPYTGVPIYATFSGFPTPIVNGQMGVAADTGNVYEVHNNAWVLIASAGTPGVPGGSSGQIQYNNGGSFGGDTSTTDGAGNIDVTTLQFGSSAKLSSGNTNPSVTALAGNAGDNYFSTLTKSSYVKFDSGTTTNWIQNSPVTTFVFQPGGTAGENVYTSWATLYAALVLVKGLVDVIFDNTYSSCTIPAGTYSLLNVVFQGPLTFIASAPIVVTLANGVVFTDFPSLSNAIALNTVSAAPIYSIGAGQFKVITMLLGSQLTNSTGAAMIDVAATATLYLSLGSNGQITGATSHPVIKGHGACSIAVFLDNASTVDANTIAGDASTQLVIAANSTSCLYNATQADFAGTKPLLQNTSFYGATSNLAVTLNANAASAAYALTLPAAQGAATSTLVNNGSGALTWNTQSSLVSGSVSVTQVSNNVSYFPTMISASATGSYPLDVATGLSFNPSTSIVTTTGLNLSGLSASSAVATDGSKNLVSVTNTGSGSNVLATGPTMTNPVVGTQATTDASTLAASTAYVTTAIANAVAGVNPAVAVQAATTTAGNTSGFTYNNGVSGIGATLTGPSSALVVDGYTFTAAGQRLLVKDDTQSPSGAFNGVYYVTQIQTGVLPLILTRALDYDTPSDINNTGAIPVVNGTVNGTTSWLNTAQIVTVGTTPFVFVKFSRNPADYLLVANNLSDVAVKATSFNNLSPMTTGGDLIYGGASGAGTRLANGSSGQVLTSAGTTLAPTWATPTAAAVQSDQETGTSTTVFVSPGTQKYHPSAPKAWVSWNGTGTVAILGSYNVSSITDNGVGNYTVNFTTAFSGTTYAGTFGCIGVAGVANVIVNERQDTPVRSASANAIYTANSSTFALIDTTVVSACYLGDQ